MDFNAKQNRGWICCQLGAREHYAVPRALHRRGRLECLATEAWIGPGSVIGRLKPGLRARFHRELASAEVCAHNSSSIVFELRASLRGLRGWSRIMARNELFQRMVVGRLSGIPVSRGPLTVMAYSYAARDIFKLARARGWRTILGQIDPGPPEDRLVAELYARSPLYVGDWERPPPEYWSRWREECELADRIVVNSSWSLKALVSEGVPSEKIKIVSLAYEPPQPGTTFRRKYPAAFGAPSRPMRVLFLGQVNLRKGIGPLLEAIRILRSEPIEFTFVGPVQLTIPPDLRNDPQIRWMGSLPHAHTAEFYRDADLFIFPTFSDGFGLTQLEAQAWKLPIITTEFCGEVVEDGRNGWVLPSLAPDAIAASIRRCLRDTARLQELSDNAVVGGRFDLQVIGDQWLGAFD
jgi:glycosyltransferase involved in cell wall biosynthesis